MTRWSPFFVALGAALCTACGPPPAPRQRVTHADTRHLTQRKALQHVAEVLDREGIAYTGDWTVDIGASQPLEADLRLAGGLFGIEWVSPQDRADYGDAIPKPDPDGQLRILSGSGDDARVQILVLEAESYRYTPRRTHVERGVSGIRDTEARLQRDVRDFLSYVRGQGGP